MQSNNNRSSMSQGKKKQEAIKYGDVFNVSGQLANKTVSPQDAAMMQTAESMVFGRTPKDGPAAIMQSAASRNQRAGHVTQSDVTDLIADDGVTVSESELIGSHIITESFAGQVVRKYANPAPVVQGADCGEQAGSTVVTIGEALEASAHSVGNKAVDRSDAAAVQAAEARATGSSVMVPSGLAAAAQKAAAFNAAAKHGEDIITLSSILSEAVKKLPADKAGTEKDAAGVEKAELRNNPNKTTTTGGVASSVAAAARLNERMSNVNYDSTAQH